MEEKLISWMKSNNMIDKETKLDLRLEKIVKDRYGNGNDSRYFRCFINGNDVSQMLADFVHLKHSTAKATNGCVIVHGCGMDMAFWLQYRVYNKAVSLNYLKMFDSDKYNLV